MSPAPSLQPELDDVVSSGSLERRADAVRRIADLFVQRAAQFGHAHVDLFDGVLLRLVPDVDVEIRGELARRFCSLGNAPPQLIAQLAQDEDIGIAGPLLRRSSQIDDDTLVELAGTRGQTHLMAISERATVPPPISDVIVRRGDRDVLRSIAVNAGAQFSESGFSGLVRRATHDVALVSAIGSRADLSSERLKDLLTVASDTARRRLIETAPPGNRIAINRLMHDLAATPQQTPVTRDFAPAQRLIVALHHGDELTETTVQEFAQAFRYEETVAALSAMSGVRIATLDPLMAGDSHDPMLMLSKALGFDWRTVRLLIGLRLGPDRMPASPDVEEARHNFERLAPSTAQRIVGFWRLRQIMA
ncbi:DUF2336 domain-containing protein [Rhodopseudomonas sp. HC1]|uniref:DUF2336 domain-containing protein n=1 Tax=Rhodopseudomonas infernalis TaxID=2897386 RepID=UPI001EE87A83|nr:DUF2336 domain-containing protein [Rhodopseudomonas infernalis]MCG6207378.1 DUF2336 domain-containing protein [Rhodopseudomonas infernalis]